MNRCRRPLLLGAALLLFGALVGASLPQAYMGPISSSLVGASVLYLWSVLPVVALAFWPEGLGRLLNPTTLFVAGGLFVVLGVLNSGYAQGGVPGVAKALEWSCAPFERWWFLGCAAPFALAGSRQRLAWALPPLAGIGFALGSYVSSGRLGILRHANGHRSPGSPEINIWADFLAWSSLPVSLGVLLWLARKLRQEAVARDHALFASRIDSS